MTATPFLFREKEAFLQRWQQLGIVLPRRLGVKKSLRINTLRVEEETAVALLKAKGVKLTAIPFVPAGYWYSSTFSLGAMPEYLLGWWYLQETSSMLPVIVLDPQPGETVLDMAAAPGSKTTQMAMAMNNQGIIIALERNSQRIKALAANLERLGVLNTLVYRKDARFVKDFGLVFDKILLDAPCMGNCVVDKNWFKKRTLQQLSAQVTLQRELLKAAVQVLKPDGMLVYSTCSLEPEENELLIAWALQKFPELALKPVRFPIGRSGFTEVFGKQLPETLANTWRILPGEGFQPFFLAAFKKKS